MILDGQNIELNVNRVPRVGGGDPISRSALKSLVSCSPRRRG